MKKFGRIAAILIALLLTTSCKIIFWPEDDGPLPPEWTDCNSLWPAFDPLDVQGGDVRISDPESSSASEALPGIGCAYRDFGPGYAENILVSVTWSGNFPHEGAPLIHVNPSAMYDDDDGFDDPVYSLGVGAWVVHDGFVQSPKKLSPMIVLATIGNPPSDVRFLNWTPIDHVDGTPRKILLHSDGMKVSVSLEALDGSGMVQVIPPTDIPEDHHYVARHGIAIDTHFSISHSPSELLANDPSPDTPVLLDHFGILDIDAE
jgi:hypothetical protein